MVLLFLSEISLSLQSLYKLYRQHHKLYHILLFYLNKNYDIIVLMDKNQLYGLIFEKMDSELDVWLVYREDRYETVCGGF